MKDWKIYLMLENTNGYIPTNWDEEYLNDILEDWKMDGDNWERMKNYLNVQKHKKLRVYEVVLSEEEHEDYYNSEKILLSGKSYKVLGIK